MPSKVCDEITYPFPNFHGASKHRDNRQLIKLHNTLADLYIDRLISMILFYTCKKWLKSTIFTKENSFENVICKLAAILSGPQCVKQNASAIMSMLVLSSGFWEKWLQAFYIPMAPRTCLRWHLCCHSQVSHKLSTIWEDKMGCLLWSPNAI